MYFKVYLQPSKKIFFIYSNERPLKILKNYFYFMLEGIFIFNVFAFLSWRFGYAERWLDKRAIVNLRFYEVKEWTTNDCNISIVQKLKR